MRRQIGIAVIGSGRIGAMRARQRRCDSRPRLRLRRRLGDPRAGEGGDCGSVQL